MTWRNFIAYFDTHIWAKNPPEPWFTCSTCGEVRSAIGMIHHENALHPVWWLMPDGSIRIGEISSDSP